MKIEDTSDKSICFGDLHANATFRYGINFYVKSFNNTENLNAFDLTTNVICRFSAKDRVTPVNAKVVIE